MNWLLIFIPIAVALEHLRPEGHTWIFFAACLAIIPIAKLIVEATEHIAVRTGDAVGGLLNATFGNAPELIIALVALKAGLFDMVRASLIGAILANLCWRWASLFCSADCVIIIRNITPARPAFTAR